MNRKIRFWAAAAASVLLLAGGGLAFRMFQERKATEAADAAQRAKWEQQGNNSAGSRKEIDYGYFAMNEYSEQNARNRTQPFKNKTVLYNGIHYTRHTGVKAVLIMGLDRHGDDLYEERVPWEQGQTDAIYLLAHNTARNTVKILKIPRDTMAVMPATNADSEVIGEGITQLTLAFTAGDGVEKSCRTTCDATSRMLGGLAIDHYILGDLDSIADLNDMVGGVTVRIPDQEGVEKADPAFVRGSTVTLHGKQAEAFVRTRDKYHSGAAVERMTRHQIYIIAFEKKLKQCLKNDGKFVEKMFDTIESDMITDMNRSEYVDLTLSILSGTDLSDGDFLMLPGESFLGEVYDEYHPYYGEIDEMILDLFYYKTK